MSPAAPYHPDTHGQPPPSPAEPEPAPAQPPRPSRVLQGWLTFSQAFLVVTLIPWTKLCARSLDALRAGHADAAFWAVILPFWLYPLLIALPSAFAWKLAYRQRPNRAVLASILPFPLLAFLFIATLTALHRVTPPTP